MNQKSQIILYQTPDGQLKVQVTLEKETVWLNQDQISQLFQTDRTNVFKHIKNIFETGELDQTTTCAKFAQHLPDGRVYSVLHYNLDVIISVGYRVNSYRGTQFRIWATKTLKEYMIKGFVMDDERLSQGKTGDRFNYYDELLERVRAIRASEKNLYEKVKEIFATSVDYNSKTKDAIRFFATVQNKFHYAITGYTAAELIIKRASGRQKNLGMTNWKGKSIVKSDALIAKNYMLERELRQLYLLVEQFLSFAELQIERERPMYMSDWREALDEFLTLNRLELLKGKGGISRQKMEKFIRNELKKYKKVLRLSLRKRI
ncbi:virulence RhuM family protein [Candidatus Collierbacteria bacterium]|nr:virulence RhuM family protein [Candidatus Collierbacteria bacterium]